MDMMDLVRDWLSEESLHNCYIFNSVNFFCAPVFMCTAFAHYLQCLIQFYALLKLIYVCKLR